MQVQRCIVVETPRRARRGKLPRGGTRALRVSACTLAQQGGSGASRANGPHRARQRGEGGPHVISVPHQASSTATAGRDGRRRRRLPAHGPRRRPAEAKNLNRIARETCTPVSRMRSSRAVRAVERTGRACRIATAGMPARIAIPDRRNESRPASEKPACLHAQGCARPRRGVLGISGF